VTPKNAKEHRMKRKYQYFIARPYFLNKGWYPLQQLHLIFCPFVLLGKGDEEIETKEDV
jgi:hypothetical protein